MQHKWQNDKAVRWCPGCGDYGILQALCRALSDLELTKEEVVVVSGIGCSSRLPYYLNAHGFHTIHGRALTVATGLAITRTDLHVIVVTGDGDSLSIGLNHFIHTIRRNVNLTILLCNNQVFGLTKGQYSPTSPVGLVTKTSPEGSLSQPLDPLKLALASGSSFIARALDNDIKHLQSTIKEAILHQGCSVLEIMQRCPIFHRNGLSEFSKKAQRQKNCIYLQDGDVLKSGDGTQYFQWSGSKDELQIGHDDIKKAVLFNISDKNIARSLLETDLLWALGVLYKSKSEVLCL